MRKVIIDTETTGLSPEKDKIIEIAMIEIDENNQLTGNFYYSLVNPQKSIPRNATQMHGINHCKIKTAPTFEQIKDDVIKFIKDKTVISYYLPFNVKMLNYELGIELTNSVIDIMKLVQKKHPQKNYCLNKIAKQIKKQNIFNNQLLTDCYSAYLLYKRLSEQTKDFGFFMKNAIKSTLTYPKISVRLFLLFDISM